MNATCPICQDDFTSVSQCKSFACTIHTGHTDCVQQYYDASFHIRSCPYRCVVPCVTCGAFGIGGNWDTRGLGELLDRLCVLLSRGLMYAVDHVLTEHMDINKPLTVVHEPGAVLERLLNHTIELGHLAGVRFLMEQCAEGRCLELLLADAGGRASFLTPFVSAAIDARQPTISEYLLHVDYFFSKCYDPSVIAYALTTWNVSPNILPRDILSMMISRNNNYQDTIDTIILLLRIGFVEGIQEIWEDMMDLYEKRDINDDTLCKFLHALPLSLPTILIRVMACDATRVCTNVQARLFDHFPHVFTRAAHLELLCNALIMVVRDDVVDMSTAVLLCDRYIASMGVVEDMTPSERCALGRAVKAARPCAPHVAAHVRKVFCISRKRARVERE